MVASPTSASFAFFPAIKTVFAVSNIFERLSRVSLIIESSLLLRSLRVLSLRTSLKVFMLSSMSLSYAEMKSTYVSSLLASFPSASFILSPILLYISASLALLPSSKTSLSFKKGLINSDTAPFIASGIFLL